MRSWQNQCRPHLGGGIMGEVKSLNIKAPRSYVDDRIRVPFLCAKLARPNDVQVGVIVDGIDADKALHGTFDLGQFKNGPHSLRLAPEFATSTNYALLIGQYRFVIGAWHQLIKLQIAIGNEMGHLAGS